MKQIMSVLAIVCLLYPDPPVEPERIGGLITSRYFRVMAHTYTGSFDGAQHEPTKLDYHYISVMYDDGKTYDMLVLPETWWQSLDHYRCSAKPDRSDFRLE